jgi:hypothetical protein
LNLGVAKDVAEAMKTGIETVALIGAQRKRADLENRGRELDLEIKALDAELTAPERQQELDLSAVSARLAYGRKRSRSSASGWNWNAFG